MTQPNTCHTFFEGRFVKLTLEKIVRKGIERIFERVRVQPGVAVLIITPDGKHLRFIKERSWYDGLVKTKLVTGFIDPGEDALDAAKRELKEETGYEAQYWSLFLRSDPHGMVNHLRYFFVAHGLTPGEACPEGGEEILGYEDMSFMEVRYRALQGMFGSSATAFALLKYVSEHSDLPSDI